MTHQALRESPRGGQAAKLPRMSTRVSALALCGLLAGCGPAAAPPPVDQPAVAAQAAQPARATRPTADAADSKAGADGTVSLMPPINSPAPAPEPPLTQEETDLIAADPATLSPEMRRKRAFALRRKIMQNPDSPAARQLEALRIAAEKGELQPQLPAQKGDDRGVTLHARNPANPDPKTDKSAPATTPAPTPATTPAPAPATTPAPTRAP